MDSPEREWTQEELRAHLVRMGWSEKAIDGLGFIPQWIKQMSLEEPPVSQDGEVLG